MIHANDSDTEDGADESIGGSSTSLEEVNTDGTALSRLGGDSASVAILDRDRVRKTQGNLGLKKARDEPAESGHP